MRDTPPLAQTSSAGAQALPQVFPHPGRKRFCRALRGRLRCGEDGKRSRSSMKRRTIQKPQRPQTQHCPRDRGYPKPLCRATRVRSHYPHEIQQSRILLIVVMDSSLLCSSLSSIWMRRATTLRSRRHRRIKSRTATVTFCRGEHRGRRLRDVSPASPRSRKLLAQRRMVGREMPHRRHVRPASSFAAYMRAHLSLR